MEHEREKSPNPEQPVQVTSEQYGAALAFVRGRGNVDPEDFAIDIRENMSKRDLRTGEVLELSDVETSREQSDAIIRNLQARGVLSTSDNPDGRVYWLEGKKHPEAESRKAKVAKASGRMMLRLAKPVTTPLKQTAQFAAHNDLSELVLGPPRTMRASKAKKRGEKDRESSAQENFDARIKLARDLKIVDVSPEPVDWMAEQRQKQQALAEQQRQHELRMQQREDSNLSRQERILDRQEALAEANLVNEHSTDNTEAEALVRQEEAIEAARKAAENQADSSKPLDIVDADVVEESEIIQASEEQVVQALDLTEQEHLDKIARDVVRENEDTVSPFDAMYERVRARHEASDQAEEEPLLTPGQIRARTALPPRQNLGSNTLSERLAAARHAADASEAAEILKNPDTMLGIADRFNEAILVYREFIAGNPEADDRMKRDAWKSITDIEVEQYGNSAHKSAVRVTFYRLLSEEIRRQGEI